MPAAKPPDLRQGRNDARANKGMTPAKLPGSRGPALDLSEPPALGPRPDGVPWHEEAQGSWDDAWASPMAVEYLPADVRRLRMYVDLIHQYWLVDEYGDNPNATRTSLAREVRQSGAAFGLTPADRWRLHWTIDHGDGGRHGTARPTAPAPTPAPGSDLYAGLRAVE
jgi:hypothetical protein